MWNLRTRIDPPGLDLDPIAFALVDELVAQIEKGFDSGDPCASPRISTTDKVRQNERYGPHSDGWPPPPEPSATAATRWCDHNRPIEVAEFSRPLNVGEEAFQRRSVPLWRSTVKTIRAWLKPCKAETSVFPDLAKRHVSPPVIRYITAASIAGRRRHQRDRALARACMSGDDPLVRRG